MNLYTKQKKVFYHAILDSTNGTLRIQPKNSYLICCIYSKFNPIINARCYIPLILLCLTQDGIHACITNQVMKRGDTQIHLKCKFAINLPP